MIHFTGCKINLGLQVLEKRPDGYHAIDSVFYPVNRLEVLEVVQGKKSGLHFESRGMSEELAAGKNICEKAFLLLQAEHHLPDTEFYLQKNIPAGSGLGAGSANAAGTIILLNKFYNLNLPDDVLFEYAMQLGSDTGFFIKNSCAHVTDRGEMVSPIELNLSEYFIFIVHPGVAIQTAGAFGKMTPDNTRKSCKDIVLGYPVSEWKNHLHNDFETVIFKDHPEIATLKQMLYEAGADYASMSGSGSALYGLFSKKTDFHKIENTFERYSTWHNAEQLMS